MKKNMFKKEFIYFVVIAPILAKIIEWMFQFSNNAEFIKSVFWIQIIFIEIISLMLYSILNLKINLNTYNLTFIVGISYFIKEFYNLIMVYKQINPSIMVALIIEPVFMWAILGYFPYRYFFRGRK